MGFGIEFDFGNLINLVGILVAFAFGYGMLSQRIKTVEKRVCEIDEIRIDLRAISDTLQKLVGQFETYIKMTSKEHHE
jgi:hypothetical protein